MKKQLLVIAIAVVSLALYATTSPHGSETLMKLAKKGERQKRMSKIGTPTLPTNMSPIVRFVDTETTTVTPQPRAWFLSFQITNPTKFYSLDYSTNLINWTTLLFNMTGIQSTNSDIWTTNKHEKAAEFWRLRQQTNYVQ